MNMLTQEMRRDAGERMVLALVMSSFIVAAGSGVWLRLSMLGVALPQGASWETMRHAHSHLMFFAWVTPGLMWLIGSRLRAWGAPLRRLEPILLLAILLGALGFIPFMRDGYSASIIAGRRVPLSVITSTLSMFTWYAFAFVYVRAREVIPAMRSRALLDLAIGALVVSSFGAWLRGALVGLKCSDRLWTDGAVQQFLTTFSMGWLLLGALWLAVSDGVRRFDGTLKAANVSMLIGLSALWITSLPERIVPIGLGSAGLISAFFFGLGLLTYVGAHWGCVSARGRALTLAPAGLVALCTMSASVAPLLRFVRGAQLVVVFLHVVFLGVVSVAIVEGLLNYTCQPSSQLASGRALSLGFAGACWGLIFGMGPTTALWPQALSGQRAYLLTCISAAAPVLMMIVILSRHLWHQRGRRGRSWRAAPEELTL